MITLWFQPGFGDLLPDVQSWTHRQVHKRHAGWPEAARRKIASVMPEYTGDVPPMDNTRTPEVRLVRG